MSGVEAMRDGGPASLSGIDDGAGLSWLGIARLGLVQVAIGGIVVLATSTLNRVMVVEWHLPALVPAALVALHYVVQLARPRFGHGSDTGGRRAPWIIGGVGVMGAGCALGALAVAWMGSAPGPGIALAVLGYALIGLGVGAAGTNLLALLALRVAAPRRGAAATLVWLMMIFGFVITAVISGRFLDPFSPERLVLVSACVALAALTLTILAVAGMGEGASPAAAATPAKPPADFRRAVAETWADPVCRQFTLFVFLSMLAYSAQELVFEPFAGAILGLSPGQGAQLTGLLQSGALVGMILVAVGGRLGPSLLVWTLSGCVGSALFLAGFAALALIGAETGHALVRPMTALLGFANGLFAVGAIGAMMRLASAGGADRAGLRMGIWGAAQAIAFACGGILGAGASDLAHAALGSPGVAYGAVFALEACLFLWAARRALDVLPRVDHAAETAGPAPVREMADHA